MSAEEFVTQPGDAMMGRQIGNYRVVKKLGEGGMGAVYKLQHTTLPNTFKAMKVMHKSRAPESSMLRFQQEANVAAIVGTDKVVRVDDFGTFPDGTAYIIMEFVDGTDLADYLAKNGPLPTEAALKLVFRVADILAVAHSKGIVHRDLKPPNIMLEGGTLRPKVADWGVSRASAEGKLAHTEERAIIGTPGYMSPECALGLPTDSRTDIFSLGIILYELLTGKLPYPATNPTSAMELFSEFLARAAASIETMRPSTLERVPTIVEPLVARAIAKDVKDRYSTMLEFRDELRRALEWIADNSKDGVPRAPMMTMLSEHADTSGPQPTLRARAGEVAELIERYRTPTPPHATADGHIRAATPSAQAPSGSGVGSPSMTLPPPSASRQTPLLVLLSVMLAGAIAVGAWLALKPPPAKHDVQEDAVVVGRFLVTTSPVGATVTVDGRVIGTSPLIVNGKPGETKRVRLALPGYEEQEVTIEFAKDDRKGDFQLTARPAPAPDNPEHATEPAPKKVAKPGEHSKHKSGSSSAPEKSVNPWQ